MNSRPYSSIDIRYKSSDTPDKIFKQILAREKAYYKEVGGSKKANTKFWYKIVTYSFICLNAYYALSYFEDSILFFISYFLFGFSLLLLSLNLGHDAAHNAVSSNSRIDNFLFRASFMLQGISGYLWQIRHNNSHHVFPNVHDQDTDMDFGGIIILSSNEEKKWIHGYQHLYAPILYCLGSLMLIYYLDFEMMIKKKHGNLRIQNIPSKEWGLFFLAKGIHLSVFIALPLMISSFNLGEIILSYIVFQGIASLFMFLTFVVSHHVNEVDHNHINVNSILDDSWIKHQIVTTIDFNERSSFSHFIFGGFNLHVAHHVFPSTSHIHYPALTKIIKDVLADNGVSGWYKSYSFYDGCISHFKYLKSMAKSDQEITFHSNLKPENNA